jgi:hypothetical protein
MYILEITTPSIGAGYDNLNIVLELFFDKNYVGGFERSNVLSGHSTHHKGQMQLICWKRVLMFVFIEEEW